MCQKACKRLFAEGKWSEIVCKIECSRLKQVKCSFLAERNREAANACT